MKIHTITSDLGKLQYAFVILQHSDDVLVNYPIPQILPGKDENAPCPTIIKL